MPWWVTTVVLPLCPALIAILMGLFYVSFPRAVYVSIGQGQLCFIAVGIASSSIGALFPPTKDSVWTFLILCGILGLSIVVYTAAVIWRHQAAPKSFWADAFTIIGSIGLLVSAVWYASEIL